MRIVAAACAVLLLAACASSPSGEPAPAPRNVERSVRVEFSSGEVALRTTEEYHVQTDTLGVSAEELWGHLAAAYDELEIPITTVNAGARLLGAVEAPVRKRLGRYMLSRLLRCGSRTSGKVANRYEVYLTAVTQIEPLGDRSLVNTHVAARAVPGGYSGNAVRCSTTGRLERSIAGRLRWGSEMLSGEEG